MRTVETGVNWAILLDNKGVGKAIPMVLLHSPYQTKGASRGTKNILVQDIVLVVRQHTALGWPLRAERDPGDSHQAKGTFG